MAMAIGAVLYSLLQVVMIGGLAPANIANGWAKPLGTDPSDYGAGYTLALAVGAGWLAEALVHDWGVLPGGHRGRELGYPAPAFLAVGGRRGKAGGLAKNKR